LRHYFKPLTIEQFFMKKILLLLLIFTTGVTSFAQLKIDNATFFIQPGATVTVQGDVTSNVDIQGTGLLLLKGSALQNVDMGGATIPNLELDNATNATLLNNNARIGNSFVLTNGKFQTGNLNLTLSPIANITGQNASKFIWTNGTGQLKKELTANVAAYELPVGENTNYRPAYLTTTGSSFTSANFGVRVLGTPDPNKPPSTASHLNAAWPITKTGITGGTVTLEGQYIDPTDVTGSEANVIGYFNNGTDWTSVGETHNAGTNRISAPVTANNGSLSGINKFLLVGSRAFLQGAYDPVTGLMNDNLRTLPFGSSASTANFPSTDPYRVAPYNTAFTHINNAGIETITSSTVVTAQAINADNIVDWVFLELRNLNASPGNTILQTRSALIQKDGDIVDVDGVSPVTFNNLADGNYILAVRHRNHLGLSVDQTSPRAVNETKSAAFTTNVIDIRTATDPQLFGTAAAYATATHPVLGVVNLLWGGDASGNAVVRYQGSNGPAGPNDRAVLLQSLGNIESNILTGYYRGDLNINRIMRYQGSNGPTGPNDRVILLQILNNVESTIRTQSIPN
jgi:hypothetical protein